MAALQVFTVHETPGEDRPAVLVPEGFSWTALFLGWIWLVAHGALLAAIVLLALWAGVARIADPSLRLPLIVGLVVAQGVLGQDLRRLSLRWRGYAEAGVVAAPDAESARLRLADAEHSLSQHLHVA